MENREKYSTFLHNIVISFDFYFFAPALLYSPQASANSILHDDEIIIIECEIRMNNFTFEFCFEMR